MSFNINVYQIHNLLNMYKIYNERQTNPYIQDSIKSDLNRISELGIHCLSNLTLDYSLEEIEKKFEETGVIVLRNPQSSKKLLLGCGNCPVDKNFDAFIHHHKDAVTINPEITMNPTIIGAFGKNIELNKVLPENFYTILSYF